MNLRDELIQVAAVAIAIVTDLDNGSTAPFTSGYVFDAVATERVRQNKKWGVQHHSIAEWLVILGEEYGEACKAANDEVIFPKEADDED